jgi:Tfp pilus assembly protein PilF
VGVGLTALVTVVLGGMTIRRNLDYRNEITIQSDLIAKRPNNARAHHNLAFGYQREGKDEDAIRHYVTTIQLAPRYYLSYNNLGSIYNQQGKLPEAMALFRAALEVYPYTSRSLGNLGVAHYDLKQFDKAVEYFREAVVHDPLEARHHYNLGTGLLALGRPAEAELAFAEGRRLDPTWPHTAATWAWRLLTENDPPPHRVQQARYLVEQANQATGGRYAEILDVLAIASSQQGRFEEAVEQATRAVQLAEAAGQPRRAEQIRRRLQLYQAGQPFRYPRATS